jgi:hypothetical protein
MVVDIPGNDRALAGDWAGRALKLAWLAGPIVWSVYFIGAYVLVEYGCRTFLVGRVGSGLSLSTIAAVLISLAAGGICAAAARRSGRLFRSLRIGDGEEFVDDDAAFAPVDQRTEMLAFYGMILNLAFLFVVVVSLFPLLMLTRCI